MWSALSVPCNEHCSIICEGADDYSSALVFTATFTDLSFAFNMVVLYLPYNPNHVRSQALISACGVVCGGPSLNPCDHSGTELAFFTMIFSLT